MADTKAEAEALFEALRDVSSRPRPFETYTARTLWADEHISEQMLTYHLDPNVDLASRRIEFIDASGPAGR